MLVIASAAPANRRPSLSKERPTVRLVRLRAPRHDRHDRGNADHTRGNAIAAQAVLVAVGGCGSWARNAANSSRYTASGAR